MEVEGEGHLENELENLDQQRKIWIDMYHGLTCIIIVSYLNNFEIKQLNKKTLQNTMIPE